MIFNFYKQNKHERYINQIWYGDKTWMSMLTTCKSNKKVFLYILVLNEYLLSKFKNIKIAAAKNTDWLIRDMFMLLTSKLPAIQFEDVYHVHVQCSAGLNQRGESTEQ